MARSLSSPLKLSTAALLAGSLLFSACSKDDDPTLKRDLRPASHYLTQLDSCSEVDDYIVDILTEQYASYFGGYYNSDGSEPPVAAPGESADDSAGGGGAPDDYTETNTQEADVDEADIVKTDGEHVYVAQNNLLKIVKSWPAEESEVIADVELVGNAQELYLQDDRLVVIAADYRPCQEEGCNGNRPWDYWNRTQWTVVSVYDISDRSAPTLTRTFDIEGYVSTSRAVEDTIYLVASNHAYSLWTYHDTITAGLFGADAVSSNRGDVFAQPLTQELYDKIRATVVHVVGLDDLRDALIPNVAVNGGASADAFSCADLYAPDAPSWDLSATSILAIDPGSDTLPGGAGVLSSGWTVYGSSSSIYISRHSQNWNRALYDFDPRTDIHRFALNAGKPSYASSGSVPGFQYDRFGYSERDGYLRVATTDAASWWWGGWGIDMDGDVASPPPSDDTDGAPDSETGSDDLDGSMSDDKRTPTMQVADTYVQANNLFVLQEDGRDLTIVGEVRGYGANESIYGIRYVGDMAYVVTFRRTDPLYAINLSDPKNPVIEGELKIPGFSDFLQSIGDDLLLGVGMDADDTGRTTGFQVQLFDVSDSANPIRTSQLLFPFGGAWSSSIAQYESRAFTWYASRELLSIPFSSYDYSQEGIEGVFNGALVMRVTAAGGVQEVGRLNHASFIEEFCANQEVEPKNAREPGVSSDMAEPGYGYDWDPCSVDWAMWATQYLRSVFIGDYLFGVSSMGLTVSHIDDISTPIIAISLL